MDRIERLIEEAKNSADLVKKAKAYLDICSAVRGLGLADHGKFPMLRILEDEFGSLMLKAPKALLSDEFCRKRDEELMGLFKFYEASLDALIRAVEEEGKIV